MPFALKRQISQTQYHAKPKRVRKTLYGPKLDQRIKQLINKAAETKYFDESQALIPIPTGGGVNTLNDVPLGTDYNNRLGRHINPKYSVLDFLIKGPTNIYFDTGFVALVWDKQPNGGVAPFNSVFDTTVSPIGLNFKMVATNKDRFQVLWQEDFVCQANASGNFEGIRMKKYYNLAKLRQQCEFYNAGPTLNTGALLVVYASYANTGSNLDSASITYNHRFAYTDE